MTEEKEKLITLYPEDLITQLNLADGIQIMIRPVRINDGDIIQEFSQKLSDELKHLNYMESFKEFSTDMVRRLTHVDYKKTMTLVATHNINNKEEVIGIVHYISMDNSRVCEFDIIVSDAWHHRGIGTLLTEALIKTAKKNGIKTIKIFILANNIGGMKLAKAFNFSISKSDDPTIRILTKEL